MPEQIMNCPQCHSGIYVQAIAHRSDELIVCPHCRAVSFYADVSSCKIVALRRPRRALRPSAR